MKRTFAVILILSFESLCFAQVDQKINNQEDILKNNSKCTHENPEVQIYWRAHNMECLVPTYDSDATPQPYIILGKIHVEASKPKMLSDKIRKKALTYHADAIIRYKIQNMTAYSGWTGSTINNAEGILIRWALPGEKGLTKITDTTPIPVLE